MIDKEERERLHLAITKLPERDQKVIRYRLAGKVLSEIGAIIGVTKERVRQIEMKSTRSLKLLMA